MSEQTLTDRLSLALKARSRLLTDKNTTALRLFAGFYEGDPDLVVDLYGQTLVIYDYKKSPPPEDPRLRFAEKYYLQELPEINCILTKYRHGHNNQHRRGVRTLGNQLTDRILESGITYSVNLRMNRDAGFYLDTRNLRIWLLENARSWRVLNTFAYTGSLGIAALAGGAAYVHQIDLNKKFLAEARKSAIYNRLDLGKMKLRGVDFFSEISRLKRQSELFDCAIIDPPIFSTTRRGDVDLKKDSKRLINKVRPLIKHGGWLVMINNSIFLSGSDYKNTILELSQDGFLSIETIIPIPQDITGFPETIIDRSPINPAPFNHSTKIALLKVKRKK